MCMTVRMDGLNKSGSHLTGHHNQSDSLVGFEWAWLCQKERQLTHGKCQVGEKRQYDRNGGGECRGKYWAVRDNRGMMAVTSTNGSTETAHPRTIKSAAIQNRLVE